VGARWTARRCTAYGIYSASNACALQDVTWARTLDGAEYMPGLVGLNDMRANDYANVIIQVALLTILYSSA